MLDFIDNLFKDLQVQKSEKIYGTRVNVVKVFMEKRI